MSLGNLEPCTQKLVSALETEGLKVTPYYWQGTQILLGFSFDYDGSWVVFRVEAETEQIIVVKVQRQSQSRGLNNPLAILFLLAEVALAVFSVSWKIRGDVDVSLHSRLSSERLGRFYQRWCGVTLEDETGWHCIRLADYRPLKGAKK